MWAMIGGRMMCECDAGDAGGCCLWTDEGQVSPLLACCGEKWGSDRVCLTGIVSPCPVGNGSGGWQSGRPP